MEVLKVVRNTAPDSASIFWELASDWRERLQNLQLLE
jgi:hypothetical protein